MRIVYELIGALYQSLSINISITSIAMRKAFKTLKVECIATICEQLEYTGCWIDHHTEDMIRCAEAHVYYFCLFRFLP